MEGAVIIAEGRDYAKTILNQSALSRTQRIFSGKKRARNMFGKAFRGRDIFGDKIAGGLGRDPGWIVQAAPGMVAILHQARDQQPGHYAIGNTLSRVTGDQPNVTEVGMATHKSRIVDRLQHLAGPAVGDLSGVREPPARPCLDSLKANHGIVRLAGFVVFAANS